MKKQITTIDITRGVMKDFTLLLIRLNLKVSDGYKLLCISKPRFHAFKRGSDPMGESYHSLARSYLEHEKKGNGDFITKELKRRNK